MTNSVQNRFTEILLVIRWSPTVHFKFFAAQHCQILAVTTEEEDALKPFGLKRQAQKAHTGCYSTQNTRCGSKDTVTLVNSDFKGTFPDNQLFF
ncbi:hypothetical protein F2P81_002360 [Scophthalmus maximus]|uniref:Uncharacterized protein n=1 Tax=Scophthalmus maximus TaxID=52904 RepID=A0A6A4TSZ3_SCOMX|nr:hypothetical protein F2P81_002360 [Scophthalmus maximus]